MDTMDTMDNIHITYDNDNNIIDSSKIIEKFKEIGRKVSNMEFGDDDDANHEKLNKYIIEYNECQRQMDEFYAYKSREFRKLNKLL